MSGYVVDHVKPLECGGADAPSNMQWQTVAAGKAKDKTRRQVPIAFMWQGSEMDAPFNLDAQDFRKSWTQ
jgi:hypothetical protein